MGQITSGISVLLGSAVVSTVITTIFNQYNNSRNNKIKYITEERKFWREEIKSISKKIQKCEFNGTGKRNIEIYLTELEVNINSYGRGKSRSAKEDAYIWNEIDAIREVNREEKFKKHKELLIYYISLMIKEDWDRSKQEVISYSQILVEVLSIIIINLSIGSFYLYIGEANLKSWIVVLAKIGIYTVTVYAIFKELQAFADMYIAPLDKNITPFLVKKLLLVLLAVFCVDILIIVYLQWVLCERFQNQLFLNLLTILLPYVESAKIFWNWLEKNIKNFRLSEQIVFNKERILEEQKEKLNTYKENMQEIYQYIKSNQEDCNKVKISVTSLKKLFKEYEHELKKSIEKESRKVMNKETRDTIDKLQKDLSAMRQYKENIANYYNIGVIYKGISVIEKLNGIQELVYQKIKRVKDFFLKERGKLE